MRIMLIPLDERPCNLLFPKMQASELVELVTIPEQLLPSKKLAGNTEGIWQYLEEEAETLDGLVVSAEMLFLGGLLPSRLHEKSLESCQLGLLRLKGLKQRFPNLKLYVSALIMRSPSYNSSEEEPDYYQDYGRALFRIGALQNKAGRVGLSPEEKAELEAVVSLVPKAVREDYESRRRVNLGLVLALLKLVAENLIDFMIIPQDDSAPFSYAAEDQAKVYQEIRKLQIQESVLLYPGADESALTLLSRMQQVLLKENPAFAIHYASVSGAQVIPKYEDRPVGESITSHLLAQGARIPLNPTSSEHLLFVNIADAPMAEAWDQDKRDIMYDTRRNLQVFIQQIEEALAEGKNCIVADLAYSNGGDQELLRSLAQRGLLSRLGGYAGWNTSGNSLGTAISMGLSPMDQVTRWENIAYHLLDDYLYQALVRQEVISEVLPLLDASYYELLHCKEQVETEIARRLNDYWQREFSSKFPLSVFVKKVYLPWNRMFEISLQLSCKLKQENAHE